MMRFGAVGALALLAVAQTGCSAGTQGEQQTLVDRATLTVQEMMTQTVSDGPRDLLRRAKGVMVCPRVFKAGFFFGGEGGSCVMLARGGSGTWSYPAFYTIGSGSFGFQFGIQDSQVLMLILTDRGLSAVLDSQLKLDANAGIAVATLGAGVQGATTTAVGADIVAFSASRGLFGGVALEGSVMSAESQWNQSYYGQPYAARQLVMQMQGANPGADPLRGLLTRYGGADRAERVSQPPAQVVNGPGGNGPGGNGPGGNGPGGPGPGPGYAPPYPAYQGPGGVAGPAGRQPVQEQKLARPPR